MRKKLIILGAALFAALGALMCSCHSTPTQFEKWQAGHDTSKYNTGPDLWIGKDENGNVKVTYIPGKDTVVTVDTAETVPDYLFYYKEISTGDVGYFLADKGAYKIGDLTKWQDEDGNEIIVKVTSNGVLIVE